MTTCNYLLLLEAAVKQGLDDYNTFETLRLSINKLADDGIITKEEQIKILVALIERHSPTVVS